MAKFQLVTLSVMAAILLTTSVTLASENTGTSVASSLRQCYNTTELYDHDQRLPATINMLIDLVRLVEDGAPSLDARTLSIQLAHRFRQDGIQKAVTTVNSDSLVLPFSPKGEEFFKNKIFLQRLLPGDASMFPNTSLTVFEQCNLHFMSSNTVELQVRNDESTVCRTTANYVRRPREAEDLEEDQQEIPDLVHKTVERVGGGSFSINQEVSDCPVENGVVYTRWGEVHAGTVLIAIAAGLEPQVFQEDDLRVDSKYAVTIAGDLAEVAFYEGAIENKYTIGARGGWNSTLAPHWYFIENGKTRKYFTNPEMRADLDGLIIASNIRAWAEKYRNMKVSQILDAYYSNRGVFSSQFKACNRNKFAAQYAPQEKLTSETKAFAELYNKHTILGISPSTENIDKLVNDVIQAYNRAITSIADAKCDDQDVERTATDLILAVDTNWSFDYIHRTVSYLLDNLDINKYESTYAVVNAKDGSIIVDQTPSLAKFAQYFNRSLYDKSEKGFDAAKLMTTVEKLYENRATYHQDKSKLNGKSATVVLMPKSPDSSQGSYIASRFSSVIENYYPGTQHIVLGTGSREVYDSFVRNPTTDIFIVPENIPQQEDQVKMTLNNMVVRLREAPRLIINPKCGTNMIGESSSDSMELYVEPGTTNNYKVASTYLTGEGMKTLIIRSQSNGNLTICSSTNDEKAANCENLGSGERSFDLSSGSDFNFSLTAGKTTESSSVRCADIGCRFPDNVKVSVQVDGFSCRESSGATSLTTSLTAFITVISVYLITISNIN